VQPAGHFVESLESGADAADTLAGIEERSDSAREIADHRRRRLQLLARPRLAELQQRFFGRRQDLIGLLFADQTPVDQFLRAENQPRRTDLSLTIRT